ncbi:hypothetical protein Pen02_18670 [Plantactinospora endophytica]|uniref:Uncharacterized protein n=1 Tax=Plantactinospora endophytica TaxID=673535 RepID=A0ABQ4DWV4_9ACTN|nr:hypothetical protein Pen02_18670 [Plantactinospora endophytica]
MARYQIIGNEPFSFLLLTVGANWEHMIIYGDPTLGPGNGWCVVRGDCLSRVWVEAASGRVAGVSRG